MKIIILIFLLYIPIAVVGQCQVQFLIEDSCIESTSSISTEIALMDSVGSTLKRSDGIYNLIPGVKAHVLITFIRNGKYLYLSWNFIVPNQQKLIKTLKIPDLIGMHTEESVQSEVNYYQCNELASGLCIDYYENDKVRINGKFNEGIPVGKLYTYHLDGKLNYKAQYSPNGKFKKSKLYLYDNNGLLKEIVHFRNFVDFMNNLTPSQGGPYGFVGFEV